MRKLAGLQNHLAYLVDLYEFVEAEMQKRPEYYQELARDMKNRRRGLFGRSLPDTFRWHAIRIASISEELSNFLKKHDFDPFLKEGIKKMNLDDFKSLWESETLDKLSVPRLLTKKSLTKIASSHLFRKTFFERDVLMKGQRTATTEGSDVLIHASGMFRMLPLDYNASLVKIGVLKSEKIGTPDPIWVVGVGLVGLAGVGNIIWDASISRDPQSIFTGLSCVGGALVAWRALTRSLPQ